MILLRTSYRYGSSSKIILNCNLMRLGVYMVIKALSCENAPRENCVTITETTLNIRTKSQPLP